MRSSTTSRSRSGRPTEMRSPRLALVLAAVLVAPLLLTATGLSQTLALYEDFEGSTIDPTRWRGYQHDVRGSGYRSVGGEWDGPPVAPGISTERRRDIVSGELRLGLTTLGIPLIYPGDYKKLPHGRVGVRLGDVELADGAPLIRGLSATVTVTAFDNAAPVCEHPLGGATGLSRMQAGLVGVFFNDGTSRSRSDRTGDVMATLTVVENLGDFKGVYARVYRCVDPRCEEIRQRKSAYFPLDVVVGVPVTLTIRWQPDRTRFVFTVGVDGGADQKRALGYATQVGCSSPQCPPLETHYPPVGYVYDLRLENEPGMCRFGGDPTLVLSSEARFDDVKISRDTAGTE